MATVKRSLPVRRLTVTLCLVALSVAAGCKSPPPTAERTCEDLYETWSRCDSELTTPRPEFVERCARTPIDFAPLRACAASDSCDAWRTCRAQARTAVDARRRQNRTQNLVERIDEAIREADWHEVVETCRLLSTDPDPAPAALTICRDVGARALLAMTIELEALREAPAGQAFHLDRCNDLRYFARRQSPAADLAAQRLCNEAALAFGADRVIQAAYSRVAAKQARLLPDCRPMIARLDQLATLSNRQWRVKLLDACYVRLGKVVLDSVGKKPAHCPVELRRLIAAVDQFTITEDAIATVVDGHRTLCGATPAGPGPEPSR